MKNLYETDIAVLLIFFNRPDNFKKVFEQVKKARPSRLYLSCDGAREGNQNDVVKIAQCKEIAKDIDWECEVYENYSDVNLGCGRGPKAGIDFMFQREEYGIILEDDCIPSVSFFRFCKEMLEKYKDDRRIYMVTGLNSDKESLSCEDSYFFGYSGANWGWATWKREWEKLDYELQITKDAPTMKLLEQHTKTITPRAFHFTKQMKKTYQRLQNGEDISYWDLQWQIQKFTNHQLAVIPQKNLITNIGVGEDSTHAKHTRADKTAGQTVGKISFLYNRQYELQFPLKHPQHMIPDITYDRRVDRGLFPVLAVRIVQKLKYELCRRLKK